MALNLNASSVNFSGTLQTTGLSLVDSSGSELSNLSQITSDVSTLQSDVLLKAPLANPTFTGTVSGITKSMIGLGFVDNTPDSSKPISTATQSALDLKAPLANPTFTGTVSGISKSMVGLSNVDNTSDANKPISSATQTALDLKAPLANPTFTGTVSGISKSMVGLGSVDNTSDADKPISSATQTALDLKADQSTVDGIEIRLQTAEAELATAQGDITTLQGDVSTIQGQVGSLDLTGALDRITAVEGDVSTLQSDITLKAPIESPTFTGTVSGITKSMVGLGSVDNTSDVDKPVSTATQSALDLKAPIESPTFTGTVSGISKSMVGLGSVDNTSDANKPISSATQTALDLKAPIESPTFTGTVSGISKSMVGLGNVDNTSDVDKPVSTATQSALDLKVDLTGGTLSGNLSTSAAISAGSESVYASLLNDGTIQVSDGTNTMTISPTSITVNGDTTTQFDPYEPLPTQTGNSGKYLTTDGSSASWATVSTGDTLPSQTGNSGKYLTTDGSSASWATVASGGATYQTIGASANLLLHFEDSTDSSLYNSSINRSSGYSISSVQKKFGSSSYFWNNSLLSHIVYTTGSTEVGFDDFTISMWVYPTVSPDYGHAFTLGTKDDGISVRCGPSNFLYFYLNGSYERPTLVWTTNTWYHLAVTRKKGIVRIFINGTLSKTSALLSGFVKNQPYYTIGNECTDATVPTIGTTYPFKGYIDEVVFVAGRALFTTSFTVPSSPYTDGAIEGSALSSSASVGEIASDGTYVYICTSSSPVTWKQII